MSLQRMGLYRYGSATKKAKRDNFDAIGYWDWAMYYMDKYLEYVRENKEIIDDEYELVYLADGRRYVDVYLYALGFIKGVFNTADVPTLDEWRDTYNGDGKLEDTGTLYREGNIWHTENSDWFYKRNYICPRGTSYFCGESIRISMCC